MARKRRGKPLDLAHLRAVLSRAILESEAVFDDPDISPELVLKVAHALAQLAGPYRQILEGDMEARMVAMERRLLHWEAHGQKP